MTVKDKCNKCLYSRPVDVGEDSEMLRACLYILIRGERRPCPAGAGCTVYEPVPKKERPSWL